MILSLYIIVSTTFLVQSIHSAVRNNQNLGNPLHGYQRNAFPQSKDSNTHNSQLRLLKLSEIKHLLSNVLQDVFDRTREGKRDAPTTNKKPSNLNKQKQFSDRYFQPKVEKLYLSKLPEWAKWTEWSPCSVSCGKGREIRWRHCLQNCNGIETEMQEKTCQLPACGGKLFGLIKL